MMTDPGDHHCPGYRMHEFELTAKPWSPHGVYLALGGDPGARQLAYRALISEVLDQDVIAKIRQCADSGLVLSTKKHNSQVAKMVD